MTIEVGATSPIKSIQRGAVSTGGNLSISVAAVNIGKAFLLANDTTASSTWKNLHTYSLLNSTTVRVDTLNTGGTSSVIKWELIEYV